MGINNKSKLWRLAYRIAYGSGYEAQWDEKLKEDNMSKREEFKQALKTFYNPNWRDVWKVYERIHPPEFKPGDYVTYIKGGVLMIGLTRFIENNVIKTKSDCYWPVEEVVHSTPEEIEVYNKRIKQ